MSSAGLGGFDALGKVFGHLQFVLCRYQRVDAPVGEQRPVDRGDGDGQRLGVVRPADQTQRVVLQCATHPAVRWMQLKLSNPSALRFKKYTNQKLSSWLSLASLELTKQPIITTSSKAC